MDGIGLEVTAVSGRAVFNDVGSGDPDSSAGFWVLRLESSWGTVVTDSFEINYPPSLHFESGNINGQGLGPQAPTMTMGVGDSIVGAINLTYSTNWGAASIVLGMSSTWDRREDVAPCRGLPTPVRNGVTRDLPINLRAPSEPGTYHIIFAFAAEEDTKQVF